MKIYFAGSIRGGREDANLYADIISHLKKYGTVLTEHVADTNLIEEGEEKLSDHEIHERDLNWLLQSDILVAEVSTPSLGVGYEIRTAVEKRIRILCLYRNKPGKSLSAMINGCRDISVLRYEDPKEITSLIDNFLENH